MGEILWKKFSDSEVPLVAMPDLTSTQSSLLKEAAQLPEFISTPILPLKSPPQSPAPTALSSTRHHLCLQQLLQRPPKRTLTRIFQFVTKPPQALVRASHTMSTPTMPRDHCPPSQVQVKRDLKNLHDPPVQDQHLYIQRQPIPAHNTQLIAEPILFMPA